MPVKTKDEVILRARQLASAGASPEDIEQYVSLASKELEIASPISRTSINQPSSQAETAVKILRTIPRLPITPREAGTTAGTLGIGLPKLAPAVAAVEAGGEKVKSAVRSIGENVMQIQLPKVSGPMAPLQDAAQIGVGAGGALIKAAGTFGDFKPSEFALAVPFTALGAMLSGKIGATRNAIAENFLGTDAKLIKKELKTGVEGLSEKLIQAKKLGGSRKEVAAQADEIVEKFEDAIQSRISAVTKEEKAAKFHVVQRKDVVQAFDETMESLKASGFRGKDIKQVQKLKEEFIKTHPSSADIAYWNNKTKRAIYREIGDIGYVKENTTAKVEAQKAVARKINDIIAKVDPEIGQLSRRQGFYLAARNSIINLLAKKEKHIFGPLVREELERLGLFLSRRELPEKALPVIGAMAGPTATRILSPPRIKEEE